MKVRQIVVLVIFGIILLISAGFKYTVKIDQSNGDRTVTYGVPGLIQTSYYDKATSGKPSDPYEGIPTEKKVASNKTKALIIISAVGLMLFFALG